MEISIGVIHSVAEFCDFISREKITKKVKNYPIFYNLGFSCSFLFDFCQKLKIIYFDENQKIVLTDSGHSIVENIGLPHLYVRIILKLYVKHFSPTWAFVIPGGRIEFTNSLENKAKDILQIFQEAELFEFSNDEIVDWWDEVSDFIRKSKANINTLTGRKGERLTLEFERRRTGMDPQWVSIESNFSGYDVLSIVSSKDNKKLAIEVKASIQKISGAYFYFTKNEYLNAKEFGVYHLYLWNFSSNVPKLCIVDFNNLEKHLPLNRLKGNWESCSVPFSCFYSELGFTEFT